MTLPSFEGLPSMGSDIGGFTSASGKGVGGFIIVTETAKGVGGLTKGVGKGLSKKLKGKKKGKKSKKRKS